jgi:hypothetical protein
VVAYGFEASRSVAGSELLHREGAVFACGGTMQDYVVYVSHIGLVFMVELMVKVGLMFMLNW